jgi:thymidylate kinase
VTDIAVDFSLSKGEMISLVERLLEMLPIPDLVILLDIDEQIAFSRKNDVASMSYLIDRRSRYQELASAFPFFIVINADRDPNEIKLEILSCIRARMGDIQ